MKPTQAGLQTSTTALLITSAALFATEKACTGGFRSTMCSSALDISLNGVSLTRSLTPVMVPLIATLNMGSGFVPFAGRGVSSVRRVCGAGLTATIAPETIPPVRTVAVPGISVAAAA